MNQPHVQHSAQSAAHGQDQTDVSEHNAAGYSSSKAAAKPEAEFKAHVCTDACTHEGATKGSATSFEKSAAAKATPGAPKSGYDAAARDR